MNWLQSFIYGLLSGLCEFMPVSSFAHQELLRELFGTDRRDVLLNLVVHIAALAALFNGCRALLEQLKRNDRIARRIRRGREGSLDLRIVKSAAIPMLVGYLVLSYAGGQDFTLPMITMFLLLNGIIIFLSGRMLQGNKDARSMSKLDSFLIGMAGAFSALPGISRVGSGTAVAISRGADRLCALNWSLLLSIPALVLMGGMDVISLFSAANLAAVSGNILSYILAAAGSFVGGYSSIIVMKFLAVKVGFSGFAYYSWGAALFTFVLYLL